MCGSCCDRAVGIDTGAREVVTPERRLPYDFLVIAAGARHDYFGHDDWAAHAPGLKSIDDATSMRRRILLASRRRRCATTRVNASG